MRLKGSYSYVKFFPPYSYVKFFPPYSYVKFFPCPSKQSFVMHVTLTLHTLRAPRVTRNTSIFYEIKKPSKIGGLVLVAPKEDAVYFRNFWAVSNVMR